MENPQKITKELKWHNPTSSYTCEGNENKISKR